jgi:hypothetical protein
VFLADRTERSSAVELVRRWILVASGIKKTILATMGRYPLPRWLIALVPHPPTQHQGAQRE